MLANEHALFYESGAGHRVIQIASQLGVDRVALHESSPGDACCTRPDSWDGCERAGVSRLPSRGSKSSFRARRPRKMRDFTVPTLQSSTSASSSLLKPSKSSRSTAPPKNCGI